jgi:predicted  nucleic acid-binding Zn-ribbon protein
MLVRMELDRARKTFLTGFFETYLRLSAEEEKQLEAAMGNLNKEEVEKMLELTTSWEKKGKREGKIEGQADILLRLLRKKFGPLPAELEAEVRKMPAEKLEQLAEAIFELKKLEEVKAFL